MFRFQINILREAEATYHIKREAAGYYVTDDNHRRITKTTVDKEQAVIWMRVLVVRLALKKLRLPASPTAGLLAANTYSAFAYEVERVK
jgi:hypothetical protein